MADEVSPRRLAESLRLEVFTSRTMRTYTETLSYLYGLQRFGVKLGLDNTRRLFALLGNPHESLRFIHVAGTNGKGSVCAMLASIFRVAGYRTAMYTSPHLVSFCERIQINGVCIPDDDVVRLIKKLRVLAEQIEKETKSHPTFFEIVTAMAAQYFREQNADIVIWETGLGGRLDATNIVTPLVSVITNIAMDHTQQLGDSLNKIAAEKSGIIKPGVPVVTAVDEWNDPGEFKSYGEVQKDMESRRVFEKICQAEGSEFDTSLHIVKPDIKGEPEKPKPLSVIRQHCNAANAPLFQVSLRQGGDYDTPGPNYIEIEEEGCSWGLSGGEVLLYGLQKNSGVLKISLNGVNQLTNAALAVTTIERCLDKFTITPDHVREGLAKTYWPARLQYFEAIATRPAILLDGAHNVDAAISLHDFIEEHIPRPLIFILGINRDKDYVGICQALAPLAEEIFCVRVKSQRAADPAELVRALNRRSFAKSVTDAGDFATAWDLAKASAAKKKDAVVVITGSLFLCGEALAHLKIPVFGKVATEEFLATAQ